MNEQIGNKQVQKLKNEYFKQQTEEMKLQDKALQDRQTMGDLGISMKAQQLDRMYSFQESYDEDLIARMQDSADRVLVKRSAPDAIEPEPAASPEEESKKQRRERHRVANESSAKIKEIRASVALSQTPEIEKAAKGKYDPRSLNSLCDSFYLDSNGNPLTELDRDTLIRNKQRLHDYVLGSEKEHNEILRQLTDEFLNARIDLNTVSSPQEAAKNINYLDKISNMSVYFNNIMDNNKDYFAALDTQTRQKIDARFAMLQKSQFPQKLTAAMGCYNIRLATGQFNSTDLDDETAKQSRQDAKDSFDNGKKTARSAILDYQNKLAVIDILQTTEQKRFEQDKENKERMGVSFPGGAEMRDYVKVKQCRDRFLEHPETYARNKALLDDSYTAYYRMTAERVEKTRQIDALTSVIEKLEKKAPAAGSEDALRKEAAEKTRSDAIKEETLLNNFLQGIETLMTDTLNGAERSEEDKRYAWFLQVNWESNSVEIAQTVNKMKDMDDSRNLLMTPDFLKRAKEKHEFVRSLDVFSQPFKLDLKGQPKNEADKAILKQNCDFAEAYAFGTAEQRKECLDKIVQMTLDLHFEPDMLDDPRQVLQKLPEYKTMSAKLTFIEDFKTHNPNYFDQLDEKKKAQLDRLRGFYANFGIALTNVSKLYGINMTENMNEGTKGYELSEKAAFYDNYQNARQAFKDQFNAG